MLRGARGRVTGKFRVSARYTCYVLVWYEAFWDVTQDYATMELNRRSGLVLPQSKRSGDISVRDIEYLHRQSSLRRVKMPKRYDILDVEPDLNVYISKLDS